MLRLIAVTLLCGTVLLGSACGEDGVGNATPTPTGTVAATEQPTALPGRQAPQPFVP